MKTTTKTKTLSLGDFKRYVNSLQFRNIIIDSSDQHRNNFDSDSPVYVSLSFDTIIICLCPNIICLKSCNSTIVFNGVSKVEVSYNCVIGTPVTITCTRDGGTVSYRILFIDA